MNFQKQTKRWELILVVFVMCMGVGLGQSTAGDISFTALNVDGDDDFAIVALVDLSANSTIYFSDNEPNADGTGFLDFNEGTLEWNTGGSTISAGTIVVFTDTDASSNPSFGASVGTLSVAAFDAGMNLSGTGDALYAVVGSPDGNNISAWLAGIQNAAGSEGANFNQTGLTSGTTFIEFYVTSSPDGGYYSGVRSGKSSFSDYLALLGDNTNWTEDVSNGENILPISTTAFSVDNSLPVELSAWSVNSNNGTVTLNWTTESEIENQGFIIERSQSSETAFVELASFATDEGLLGQGSTSARHSYTFTDKAVTVGETYSYRLADVDYQGTVTTHDELSVTVMAPAPDLRPSTAVLHAAYPNPFNPEVTVSFTIPVGSESITTLQVFDIQGRLVTNLHNQPTEAGSYSVTWDGSNAASGIYFIRLSSGPAVQMLRITLLK